jgi:hypothetical protein
MHAARSMSEQDTAVVKKRKGSTGTIIGQKLNTANVSNNRRQRTGTMKTMKAVERTAKNATRLWQHSVFERGIATADECIFWEAVSKCDDVVTADVY